MIFARQMGDPLTSLVKQIDQATAKHHAAKLNSVVVFYSEEQNLENQLKALAEKEHLKSIILTIYGVPEHPRYAVAPETEILVVAFKHRIVKYSHSFRKGELNDEATAKILAEIPELIKKR